MRIIRILAAATCGLIFATAAHALTIRFTAPTLGNAGYDCPAAITQPLTPSTSLLCVCELRLVAADSTLMWRDSTWTIPGAPVVFTHPAPPEGAYALRAWAKSGALVGCGARITFAVAPAPPAAPKTLTAQ